jgi:hypothetical protein
MKSGLESIATGLTFAGLTFAGLTFAGLTIAGLTFAGLTFAGLTIAGLTFAGFTFAEENHGRQHCFCFSIETSFGTGTVSLVCTGADTITDSIETESTTGKKTFTFSSSKTLFGTGTVSPFWGEFHDQGDAKWIVIKRQLWGHNDTPCGQPVPGRPISLSGCPLGVFGGFSYYQLIISCDSKSII